MSQIKIQKPTETDGQLAIVEELPQTPKPKCKKRIIKEIIPPEDSHSEESDEDGCTKGEKCLFTHMIVFFLLIVVFFVIYIVHMMLVDHGAGSIFKMTRKTDTSWTELGTILVGTTEDNPYVIPDQRNYIKKMLMGTPENNPEIVAEKVNGSGVGILFLAMKPRRLVCNSLLLKAQWSVVPGHCAGIRSDPDLSHLLDSWRVRYTAQGKFIDAEIKRSLPHPQFTRDNFQNNVGLIQHSDINLYGFSFSFDSLYKFGFDKIIKDSDEISISGWATDDFDDNDSYNVAKENVVPVEKDSCHQILSPVINLRDYEFCVNSPSTFQTILDHGAVFQVNNVNLGLFSWGDKTGTGLPLIIMDLSYFRSWLEYMTDI